MRDHAESLSCPLESGEGDSHAIRHAEPSEPRKVCRWLPCADCFTSTISTDDPSGKTPTGPGGAGMKDDHDRQAKTDSESKLPTKSTGREDRGELRRIFLKRQISCHENRSWLGFEQLPHMPHMIAPPNREQAHTMSWVPGRHPKKRPPQETNPHLPRRENASFVSPALAGRSDTQPKDRRKEETKNGLQAFSGRFERPENPGGVQGTMPRVHLYRSEPSSAS